MIPAVKGRLSILAAALVVARRDFAAILFSRSFIFFLIGPLFPLAIGAMASGVGQRVEDNAGRPVLGLVMSAADNRAVITAAQRLDPQFTEIVPQVAVMAVAGSHEADVLLRSGTPGASALLSGSLAAPVLSGPDEVIAQWQGPAAILVAAAAQHDARAYPQVRLAAVKGAVPADNRVGRMRTAQAAQTLMFLLTMLLAGMVLSNLVEEKANKIIEILAAAIPMDAVFLGKLFAMLAISFVGIAVWGTTIGTLMVLTGRSLAEVPPPAVGWPAFLVLGVAYFATAYLLLGAAFLTVGGMATTVREVQTLSMPVTMVQLLVFFLASYAVASPGSTVERAAAIMPFSSPFAMLARAAQEPGLIQHGLALGWQAMWVALIIRGGARLFRRRVMKSGPARIPRGEKARRGQA